MFKIKGDELRLIVLATIGLMLSLYVYANIPEGDSASLWYIALILYWVGVAVFVSGVQGIKPTWRVSLAWGGAFGGLFMFMNMWAPSIFNLPIPVTVEGARFLIVGIIAPIGEELAFRHGLYLMILRQRMGFLSAAVINSIIFALFHWVAYGSGEQTAAYVGAFSFSIIACWLTEKRGDIVAATLMHMAVNIFFLVKMFGFAAITI
jgi:membrane protease YdiL (CAAX protease family)